MLATFRRTRASEAPALMKNHNFASFHASEEGPEKVRALLPRTHREALLCCSACALFCDLASYTVSRVDMEQLLWLSSRVPCGPGACSQDEARPGLAGPRRVHLGNGAAAQLHHALKRHRLEQALNGVRVAAGGDRERRGCRGVGADGRCVVCRSRDVPCTRARQRRELASQ